MSLVSSKQYNNKNNYDNGNPEKFNNFSDAIIYFMKRNCISKSELSRLTNLQKSVITKICKNNNYKGSSYLPTMKTVNALSIGLKLKPIERKILINLAFPENEYIDECLDRKLDINSVNEILYEQGLSLFGNEE